MELRSATFYFEGFEILKQQVIKLFEEYVEENEEDAVSVESCIAELCRYGNVDIPNKGIVSIVTEVLGLPDEFEFDELQ